MIKTIFGNVHLSDQIPEGVILFIPKVVTTRYVNLISGEEKTYLQWDAKHGGVMFNIGIK